LDNSIKPAREYMKNARFPANFPMTAIRADAQRFVTASARGRYRAKWRHPAARFSSAAAHSFI
jgi:hypothetical protein